MFDYCDIWLLFFVEFFGNEVCYVEYGIDCLFCLYIVVLGNFINGVFVDLGICEICDGLDGFCVVGWLWIGLMIIFCLFFFYIYMYGLMIIVGLGGILFIFGLCSWSCGLLKFYLKLFWLGLVVISGVKIEVCGWENFFVGGVLIVFKY